jgi:serine/threonine-protein kinase
MPGDGEQGAAGADSTEASPPRVIADRYEVRDRIGRGAFGEVFEVYDRRLSRLVALKTMPIGPATDAEAAEDLRRFYMEAQSVARLSHPGIVTVHDFGEAKDFAWIVMELVIGETLKAVLDRGERPGVAETVRVICALLEALHYAHGRGIVHRDVKPANILLALGAEEGLGEVRLADFGIARIGDLQQTAVGQMVGTPATMSPEQLRGEVVDLRADLWSVGIILYEMLTAARPFPGGIPAIFHNILTMDPKPPSVVAPGVPPAFDVVIATALAKGPADRYRDAAAMAEAIRAAAVIQVPAAPAPSPLPGLEPAADDATVKLPRPAAIPAAPAARRAGGGWSLLLGFLLGLLCGGAGVHVWMTQEAVRGAVARALGGAARPAPAAQPSAGMPEAGTGAGPDANIPSAPPPAMLVPPEASPAMPLPSVPEPSPATALPPEPVPVMPVPPPPSAPGPAGPAISPELPAPSAPMPDRSAAPPTTTEAALTAPAPMAQEPPARELAAAAEADADAAPPVPASASAPEPGTQESAATAMPRAEAPLTRSVSPQPPPAQVRPAVEPERRAETPGPGPGGQEPVAGSPPDASLTAPVPAAAPEPAAPLIASGQGVAQPAVAPLRAADATPVDPPIAVPPARRLPGTQIAAVQRMPPPRAAARDQAPGRCTPAQVATRTGNHAGFGRVVFAWRVAADYALREGESGIQLRFSGPGCAPQVDRLAVPRNVRAILPDDGDAAVWIETAPGTAVRHFRLPDGRLVIDVLDAPR